MAEEWRKIIGFTDYEVSSEGSVRRVVPDARNHACRALKPWIGNHGYEEVNLATQGRIFKRLVHRLVCEAFNGPPPSDEHHVAHGDGTRRNNCADNLRWVTRSENMEDSRRHGTMALGPRHGRTTSPERTPRGEKHGHAKLTEQQVIEIRSDATATGRALAARYGVAPATICLIRSRKIWPHVAQALEA